MICMMQAKHSVSSAGAANCTASNDSSFTHMGASCKLQGALASLKQALFKVMSHWMGGHTTGNMFPAVHRCALAKSFKRNFLNGNAEMQGSNSW